MIVNTHTHYDPWLREQVVCNGERYLVGDAGKYEFRPCPRTHPSPLAKRLTECPDCGLTGGVHHDGCPSGEVLVTRRPIVEEKNYTSLLAAHRRLALRHTALVRFVNELVEHVNQIEKKLEELAAVEQ